MQLFTDIDGAAQQMIVAQCPFYTCTYNLLTMMGNTHSTLLSLSSHCHQLARLQLTFQTFVFYSLVNRLIRSLLLQTLLFKTHLLSVRLLLLTKYQMTYSCLKAVAVTLRSINDGGKVQACFPLLSSQPSLRVAGHQDKARGKQVWCWDSVYWVH